MTKSLAILINRIQVSGRWTMVVSQKQDAIVYPDGEASFVDGYLPGAIVLTAQYEDSRMKQVFGEAVFVNPETRDVIQTNSVVTVRKNGGLIPVAQGRGMEFRWIEESLERLIKKVNFSTEKEVCNDT